jgi:hypothetical protein
MCKLSLHIKYAIVDSDLSFLITVVSVIKLRLIWHPSLSLAPSACVCEALSLPARSTKFCRLTISITYNGSNHQCNLNDQIKVRMFYIYQACNKGPHAIRIFTESTLNCLCRQQMSYLLEESFYVKSIKRNYDSRKLPALLSGVIVSCYH